MWPRGFEADRGFLPGVELRRRGSRQKTWFRLSTRSKQTDVDSHEVEAVNKAENRSLYASRVTIHPKACAGTFRRLKWILLVVLLGIYYITPWLRWDRGPATRRTRPS